MSSLLTEALSLCNLAAVGIFGIVLSAAFCEIEWTRCHKLLLVGCTILMLALQGVVSLRWGTGLARYLYPLITHLPLWLLLAVMTRRALWPLVSVLTAYLCCQLRRWAALLVIALFPAGGTALHRADRHPADPSGADPLDRTVGTGAVPFPAFAAAAIRHDPAAELSL